MRKIDAVEDCLPQIGARQMRAGKIDPTQVQVNQERAAQIGHELREALPPGIPRGYSPFQAS